MLALDRLESLAARFPSPGLVTIVADPAGAHPEKGYGTNHPSATDLRDGAANVYPCGPPPMVAAVRSHMAGLGVATASFPFGKFNPSATGAAA